MTTREEARAVALIHAVAELAIDAQAIGARLLSHGGLHARQVYRVNDAANALCLAACQIGAAPQLVEELKLFFTDRNGHFPHGAESSGAVVKETVT